MMTAPLSLLKEITELQQEISEKNREVFKTLHTNLVDVYNQVSPFLKDQISELRNTRLQAVSEVKASISLIRDIREFFLQPEHSEQIKRLKEFVEVCNQLKRLKDEGTLDAIGDTILKLSIKTT